jgi:hypothetical protein
MILKEGPELLTFPKSQILPQEISSNPARIIRFLLSVVVSLSIIALSLILLKYFWILNSGPFSRIDRLFNLNIESNIPTFFSALLLLFASLLLFFIFKTFSRKKSTWLLLSGLFMFLCIDEAAQIHENLNKINLKTDFFNKDVLKHVWVVPYLILVISLAIFLKGFILHLPVKTRNLFLFAGVIFVGGAAGLEIVEGQLKVYYGNSDFLSMELLYWLEETLEMAGVTLFIYALLDYVAPNGTNILVKVTD